MNLKLRVISGCAFGAIGICAVILNAFFGFFIPLLAVIISAVCIFEFFRCIDIGLKNPYFWFAQILNALFLISFTNVYELEKMYFLGQFSLLLIFAFVSIVFLIVQRKNRIKVLYSAIIILVIMFSFGCMTYWSTQYIYTGSKFNIEALVIFLLCLLGGFVSDTAGFFVGCKFGKHKLAPKISPKKSVEGFIGSVVFEPIIFLLGALAVDLINNGAIINYPILIIVSLFCAFVATGGDLAFSAIKRANSLKDFGETMPGHGGFLDRFDSVIFTAIYISLAFSLLPIFSP